MDKKVITISSLVALLGLLFVFSSNTTKPAGASAITPEKVTICHSDGQSGNYSQTTININSVTDCTGAAGHDGHSNDIIPSYTYSSCTYAGKNLSKVSWISNNCSQPVTPTPTTTPTPTATPTLTPTPTTTLDCDGDTDGSKPDSDDGCTTPTPTLTPTPATDCDKDNDSNDPNEAQECVTTTPTATPTPTVTPAAPTATPTPGSNNGGGDGRSDGLSSCPSCTQAPQGHIQAVLGASTMASTGTFEENTMNLLAAMGIILMSVSAGYAKIFKK